MSKFSDLAKLRKTKPEPTEPEPEQTIQPLPSPSESVATVKKMGRPGGKGKSSNPDYEQVTAYIKRDTHRRVKIAMLQNDTDGDFSDLVQRLLDDYLKDNQ